MSLPLPTANIDKAEQYVVEAYKRAGGIGPPTVDKIARGRDIWLSEIVDTIIIAANLTGDPGLESLRVTAVTVGVLNDSKISLPTAYDRYIQLSLWDYDEIVMNAVDNAATNQIDVDDADTTLVAIRPVLGKYIYIYAGTGAGSRRQIVLDTSGTLTIAEVWDATGQPTFATSSVGVLKDEYRLKQVSKQEVDNTASSASPGKPTDYAVFAGAIHLGTPPDKAYAFVHSYFVNPLSVAITDAVWSQILPRWSSVLTAGLYWKALLDLDDSRSIAAEDTFRLLVSALLTRELPNADLFEGFALEE